LSLFFPQIIIKQLFLYKLMKNYATLIAISVIAIASIATITATGFSATTLAVGQAGQPATGLQMMGHLELVATDANGNIKAYIQTDNAIVDNGTDCIINALFMRTTYAAGTGSACVGDSGVFDYILLGTNASATGAPNDVDHNSQWNTPTATGLTAAVLATTVTGDSTLFNTANATVSSDFTNTGGGIETITQAALLNGTGASSEILAFQSFAGIPLDVSDSLTVDWTVTVTEG
jgi:hypothetical protein